MSFSIKDRDYFIQWATETHNAKVSTSNEDTSVYLANEDCSTHITFAKTTGLVYKTILIKDQKFSEWLSDNIFDWMQVLNS